MVGHSGEQLRWKDSSEIKDRPVRISRRYSEDLGGLVLGEISELMNLHVGEAVASSDRDSDRYRTPVEAFKTMQSGR